MTDNKARKKGEIYDLQVLLKKNLKKTTEKDLNELLKKIIMYMTLGVDVSSLFADMCLLSQTEFLLSKKMIYLYLGNQAENNPKLALMAVNTFIKELSSKSPKVRGLALKYLCQLRSEFSTTKTHIVEMLQDPDYYVQTIAIYGCLKIQQEHSNFVEQFGLYDVFYGMLKSPSSEVIVAVINVLNELQEKEGGMAITSKIITYLLNRLKEFSDYGLSVVIELAMKYQPKNEEEKVKIMNLLDSKIRSINSHLVISIIKLFLKYNQKSDIFEQVLERVKDSLLTLLINAEEELQYVLLLHVSEVIKLGGGKFFNKDYKRFFCEGDDKEYIADVKLQILQDLITDDSFDDIFNELSSYTYEANQKLASKSIKIIGDLGSKHQDRKKAILVLFMNMFKMKKEDLYDPICEALQMILQSSSFQVTQDLDELFEMFPILIELIQSEESKISLIWILGRFCTQIKHSSYMLNKYVQEYGKIQYTQRFKTQLINSVVYIFLKQPKESLPILSSLFNFIIFNEKESLNLKHKIQLYYQYMQQDIKKFEMQFVKSFETASQGKGVFQYDESSFSYLNNFSIVYHKPEESFTKSKEFFLDQRKQTIQDPNDKNNLDIEDEIEQKKDQEIPENSSDEESSESQQEVIQEIPKKSDEIDFLDLDLDDNAAQEELGIVEIDFKPSKKPKKRNKKFTLAQNEMDPSDFQQNWINWTIQKEFELTLDNELQKKEDLIEIFETNSIYCIASRKTQEELKFYFYCSDQSQKYFLMEIKIIDGDEFGMTLKGEEESENFGQIFNLIEDILKKNKFIEQIINGK